MSTNQQRKPEAAQQHRKPVQFTQEQIDWIKQRDENNAAYLSECAEIDLTKIVLMPLPSPIPEPGGEESEVIEFGDWLRAQRPDIFLGSPKTEELYELFKKRKETNP